jgi:hypothetical protein
VRLYLSRSIVQGVFKMKQKTVPVTAAQAKQQNVSDLIETNETVQSIDSVSIEPRVSGQVTVQGEGSDYAG